ncbi:MAG TPA: ACT domain-containing protein [Armatimonadota bacterium]|nr:ACT domain-containing protein [Armatimonadota bacterium]
MKVKQLSIFLENQSGRLAEVTGALGEEEINIRALSLADTSGFGILRLIVSDLAKARQVLQGKGFTVRETDVIAVQIPDHPGGLAGILAILGAKGINIEYMYAFVQKCAQNAVVIFRIEDVDQAIATLQAGGVHILAAQDVYAL